VARARAHARSLARSAAAERCRARFGTGGPYLLGAFSAADCFYAPAVFRFLSYGAAGFVERIDH